MLTPEQINNLKPGDKLALSYPLHFREYDSENDEVITKHNGEYIYSHAAEVELPSEHGTSGPTPKHDPCRLFKKGDKVRVVAWNGRAPFPLNDINDTDLPESWQTEIYAVIEGESRDDCNCVLKHANPQFSIILIHPAHLELVTPVEELEPYSVVDAHTHWEVANKDMKTVSTYSKLHHPNAKAAAEAERDRLNAEWRKEQNNG